MGQIRNSVIIGELKRIAAEHEGVLLPAVVVEEAADKRSPLHDQFEWDESVAAHQYRIEQARRLIRVSVEMLAGSNRTTDVFVSLSTDREGEGGYRVMASVLTNAQQRDQMLADALRELEIFRRKYKDLRELVEVFEAVKKVRK
jgi:hypothetical protein